MCGIVGAHDLREQRTLSGERLWRMARSLQHRGPDDSFAWAAKGIAMATQRLSIQDIEHGRQPLSDVSGRVWASQNGEIFNASELRSELISLGHGFRSRCDTEIWPALYVAAGVAAFERVRGQFAVAMWDSAERTLLLARDRIGICPLYYTVADGMLLWSSEIKGLLASGLITAEADLAGLDHVFSLFAAGTKRTAFRNVYSLLPGHYVRVKQGQLQVHRYWDLNFPKAGEERVVESESRLVDELSACLSTAVSRRFASDGPVASYLSGGLDSTLIVGIAKALRPAQPMTTFTVGFDGAGPDERPRSIRSAAQLGAELEVLIPSPLQILQTLPRVITAVEGPIMDTANACLLLLAERVAARGFKVVLTGEGADEAMGGYVWHKTASLLRALAGVHRSIPDWLRRGLSWLSTPGTPEPGFGNHFGALRPSLLDLYEPLSRARWLLYSDAMADSVRDHNPFTELDILPDRMKHWDPLHQSLYIEYKLMLPGHLLLGKGDRVSMHSSVEARYPFLDEDFIDFSSRLSPRYKLRGLREKWLLRKLAATVLPKDIANPPKSMFKANSLSLLGPTPRWIDQLVSPESLRRTGYFSVEKVQHEQSLQRLLPASVPRRFVVDGSYTTMVMTQLWHHLFFGGGLCELPSWSAPQSQPDHPFSFIGQSHAF